MKSLKKLFRIPFVIISRRRYQELIVAENKKIVANKRASAYLNLSNIYKINYLDSLNQIEDLKKELAKINLKRNAKGQFERREK